MTTITISQGDARDIASIMPVMLAAFDPDYGEAWTASQCLSVMSLPGAQLHIAMMDVSVVGFALTRGVVDEEELLLIAVQPTLKRNGIATSLVGQVVAAAKALERTSLFIEVRMNNPAIDFYRRLGFRPIGLRTAYYSGPGGKRFDATTMHLPI
jgi:[ribosomal protein S18]-alanine N-acetyltransferase